MRFLTDHGVFSISRVDHGTDLVLKTVLKDRLTAPESVLDMGCGYGWHAAYAAQHGAKWVVACDISRRMLEVAERRTLTRRWSTARWRLKMRSSRRAALTWRYAL